MILCVRQTIGNTWYRDYYKDNLHIFLTVTCMIAVKMISTFNSVIFATHVSTLLGNIYSTFFFYACSTNTCLKINELYL